MSDTLYAWSTTPEDNGTADATINWAEGQPPSTANDSARAMMVRIKQLINDMAPTRTSTGSGNAYAVTSDAAGASFRNGEQVTFLPDRSNTSACTLDVGGRGAKAWRPAPGVDFDADNILEGVPVTAYYRSSSDEWLSPGTGYYVTSLASGVSLQAITARLPQIGDLVVSYAPTPGPGRIRLGESAQSLLKSAYPELNAYLSSISYPWGSTSTHFTLPAAAGYFLRFAATSASVDTGGARAAGSTQADANKAATIPATGLTASTSTTTTTTTTTTITPNPHGHGTITASQQGPGIGSDGGGALSSGANQSLPIPPTELAASSASFSSSASTTTIGGSVSLAGANEVRVKNVAYHLDVVASTALAAAQVAVFGFPFQWDTGTSEANPGAGRVRGDNVDLASITELYISATDGWGADISDVLAGLAAGNTAHLSKVGAQVNRLVMTVSGAPTDNGTYVVVPVTMDAVSGTFASNDQLAFEYGKGAVGAPGNPGATGGSAGLSYEWNTGLSGDPGTGSILANNSDLSVATAVNISKTGKFSESNGVYLATWDDSTSTVKGHLRVYTLADRTEYLEADVTGITDNSTYVTVALDSVSGAGIPTLGDEMSVVFLRSGDEGQKGDEGEKGDKGDKGDEGDPGPPGDPQWVRLSAADVLAGEEGFAAHAKSRTAVVFDYTETLLDCGSIADFATLTRASTAAYVDRDGLLKFAGSNALRYTYDPITRVPRGLLMEGAATNIFLNSETGATQNCTVTNVPWTLSFWGTGSITLTDASTDGPLAGTGDDDRVSLTFTPSAGSLTLTVSGTCSRVQLELGSVASSYIETSGATVARSADDLVIGPNTFPVQTSGDCTLYFRGRIRSRATGTAGYLFAPNGGSASEIATLLEDATGVYAVVNDSDANVAYTDPKAITLGTDYAFAVSIRANDLKFYANGELIDSDTNLTVPTLDRIGIAPATGSIYEIDEIAYIARALTASELAVLTAA